MEVKYEVNQDLFFTITDSDITGVSTTNNKEIISILELDNIDKLNIIIDGKKLTTDEKWLFAKKTQVVTKLTNLNFIRNVEDYMDYIIKKNLIQMKNPDKKKESSLKIVGLSEKYLEREYYSLSSSEKFQVSLAISLLSNPSILILDNPFIYLDLHQEKELIKLLQRLKEQYKKIIVIVDDNSNKLYKYTNKMIFVKNNHTILEGNTTESYTRVDFLKRHGFTIPDIVEITYKAKKEKGTKIIYHKDIRDLIKDIYKHV